MDIAYWCLAGHGGIGHAPAIHGRAHTRDITTQGMPMLQTERLRLVPASPTLARCEIHDRARFAELLLAEIPAEWPPEALADALAFFLSLLEAHPDWQGWLGWYAIALDAGTPTLVGSIGFKGPPDVDGVAEMGYSVLPAWQGRGYATAMARLLVDWAHGTGRARSVIAQTTDDNLGSRAVLARLGFQQ